MAHPRVGEENGMLISAADLRELVSLFTDPAMAGLDDETVFGVDFRAESDSDSEEHQEFDARCRTWLARMPCPSVAVVSGPLRLEANTSELQSLMRISYADFYLIIHK